MSAAKFSFESFRSHLCDSALAVVVAMSTHLTSKAGVACRDELVAARDALVNTRAEHQQATAAMNRARAEVIACRASLRIGNAMAVNLGRRDNVAALSSQTSRGKNELVVPTAWKLLPELRVMGTALSTGLADFLAKECERISPLEVELQRLSALVDRLDAAQTPLAETLSYVIEQGRAALLANGLPAPRLKWRTAAKVATPEETSDDEDTSEDDEEKDDSPPQEKSDAEDLTPEKKEAA